MTCCALRTATRDRPGGATASPAATTALLDKLCLATRQLLAVVPPDADQELKYWARTLNRQCRRFCDDLRFLMPEPGAVHQDAQALEQVAPRAAAQEHRFAQSPAATTWQPWTSTWCTTRSGNC